MAGNERLKAVAQSITLRVEKQITGSKHRIANCSSRPTEIYLCLVSEDAPFVLSLFSFKKQSLGP